VRKDLCTRRRPPRSARRWPRSSGRRRAQRRRASAARPRPPDKSYAVEVDYNTAIRSSTTPRPRRRLAGAGGPAAFAEAELDFLYNRDLHEHDREVDLLALTNQADFDTQTRYHAARLAGPDRGGRAGRRRRQSEATSFDAVAGGKDQNKFEGDTSHRRGQLHHRRAGSHRAGLSDTDPAAGRRRVLTDRSVGIPAGGRMASSLGLLQAVIDAHQQRGVTEAQIASDVIGTAQHGRPDAAQLVRGTPWSPARSCCCSCCSRSSTGSAARWSPDAPRSPEAAREVAEVTRADLERVADEDDWTRGGPALLRDRAVITRDEIGDLAEAFNRVQDTAVQVLERQIAVRRNTAEMFGNVGRRIHNLTGRQLSLIDAAERRRPTPRSSTGSTGSTTSRCGCSAARTA
jgi:hypothetical protein